MLRQKEEINQIWLKSLRSENQLPQLDDYKPRQQLPSRSSARTLGIAKQRLIMWS